METALHSPIYTLQFPRPPRRAVARRRRRGARGAAYRPRLEPRGGGDGPFPVQPSSGPSPSGQPTTAAPSRQLSPSPASLTAPAGMEGKWKLNLIRRRGCPEDEPLGEASPADRWLAGAIVGAGSDDSKEEEREEKATGHCPCSRHGSVTLIRTEKR
uniref:Uncharacterized protein n=1 Tax=Oryza punctata TaxID=4537 RepID=A0A0E0KRU4_ORYPU